MADQPVMIERLRAKGYGCLKDVDVALTPLHAFIGPNDSGKSTLLRAAGLVELLFRNDPVVGNYSVGRPANLPRNFGIGGGQSYIECVFEDGRSLRFPDDLKGAPIVSLSTGKPGRTILRRPGGARLVHLEPGTLRKKGGLIPNGEPLQLSGRDGHGLASIYDAVMNRDPESFIAIQKKARELFPTLSKIQLNPVSTSEKLLVFELTDGTRVPVELVSEGLLIYLAFAALPHLDPVSLILVEEPENGLHPARIREVMRILREISKETQVLIATHSPLVVNELLPEEVSVVTRDNERGTIVTPIASTPNFEQRSKAYALGELWLSYANGDDEGPLLSGGPRP